MADSESSHDTTQQVTSQKPATKPKNPKRVAAGKAVAERTRIAREEQKKALIKAESMIAKNQTKVAPPPASETPSETESTKNVLTTTQWLSAISIFVSLAGIYYKREEIKGMFAKPTPVPPNSPVDFSPKPRGIQPMD